MNNSAADTSYYRAALPFAVFLLFFSVFFAITAVTIPVYAFFLPPFEDETTARMVALCIALYVFVMGVGFLRRRVWALYAFSAYILLGTVWHVLLGMTDPVNRIFLFSPLFTLPVGFGIYWATRGAFVQSSNKVWLQGPAMPEHRLE